ncbi:unnamed protein product [Urochloa humidicola]
MQMRKEIVCGKEALMEEKESWAREKRILILEKEKLEMKLTMRTRLAQTTCASLENQIRSEGNDKKMLYGLIMALFGLMVAILFLLILKIK